MSEIKESVEVDVPVNVAYNQWTQFEEFPQFMEGVEEVRQLSDDRLHWKAEIAGTEREWDARITEQVPDQRIAWVSEGGEANAGVVTFHKIDDNTTRVMLQLDYEPHGMLEKAGDMMGMVKHRASGDLKRFKDFIEGRGRETGAWRGNIS
ncbi:MAG TPA: SRPBCC family protein [Actinomycetota bacterium]|nr:SRPBCC family protein [Actinomycetota bacterium]